MRSAPVKFRASSAAASPTSPASADAFAAADPGPAQTSECPVLGRLNRRKRGAELEDAILSAAYEQLLEVGYSTFSVEAVATRARTGKASIYRRWPTRTDLVLDCLCTKLPSPQECGGQEFSDDVTTADALRQVARTIAGVLAGPAGEAIRAVKGSAGADPELARQIDLRFGAPRREAMLELLRRGVRRGEVRPEAVCPEVAEVLPALLHYRILMLEQQLSPAEVVSMVDTVVLPLVRA
ncbi:MAG: TetR/AcrR family transcriptional regulator [Actinobacteria bacterium]|nr:TetR/AcrR family transcriptional regulator [Actinomycetota bacterium]